MSSIFTLTRVAPAPDRAAAPLRRDAPHAPAQSAAPLAALQARYRITPATPDTGELRSSSRLFSRDRDCHVNTRGHGTGYGSARQQSVRLQDRTVAIQDVAGALRASVQARARVGHEVPGLPGAFDDIQRRMEALSQQRGITVAMLRQLVRLEAQGFVGGAPAICQALGIEVAPPEQRTPAPTRAACPAAAPVRAAPAAAAGARELPSPPRALDFSTTSPVRTPRLQPEGRYGGLTPDRPATSADAEAVVFHASRSAAAVGPASVSGAGVDRQGDAVRYFQGKYRVFAEGRPLQALTVLMLQLDSDPAFRHLLQPREGEAGITYDLKLTHAVDLIRSHAGNHHIPPENLATRAMIERIGQPTLKLRH